MTLEDIAQVMGISLQRVQQLEQKALKKVLKQLKQHDLTYEDLLKCLKYS